MKLDHLGCEKLIPQGEEQPRVTEDTAPFWCMLAERGDAEAQYQVARYLIENHPDEWPEDIERYLSMAANSADGHGSACLELAKWKLRGNPKEAPEAIQMLENAESIGLDEAAALLGECYAKGIGVAADLAEAEKHFRLLAENGDGEAKLELALRYKTGNCVPRSIAQANRWLSMAEEAGAVDAVRRYEEVT